MDSFEWNKVAGALILSLLIFMGVTLLSDEIFEGQEAVLVGVAGAEGSAPDAVVINETESNIMAMIFDANVVAGERSFRKCQQCHTANEGGADKIGPNLFGVVGRPVAGGAGFAYSGAMTGKGGTWSYEDLDAFLAKPSKAVPGTKMSFPGIKKEDERANVIAYLRLQSTNPIPLPLVPDATPEGETTEADPETDGE